MKNNRGFTIIEIIAVLILIGILAAVAVPKFFNMMTVTEEKSLQVALCDMKSRALIAHSKSMLNNHGSALTADQNDFSDLGLKSTSDLENAYHDFAGTWPMGWSGGKSIQYTGKNFTSATFTLTPPPDDKTAARIELTITE